jgi:hypothetical protein
MCRESEKRGTGEDKRRWNEKESDVLGTTRTECYATLIINQL